MSRIGKLPVVLPAGTKAELLDGNIVKVKGPHGEMSQKVDPDITVTIEGNEIKFTRPSDLPRFRSMLLYPFISPTPSSQQPRLCS